MVFDDNPVIEQKPEHSAPFCKSKGKSTMTKKEMKQERQRIMVSLGKIFTETWAKEQRDPEIAKFKRSAEECRIALRKRSRNRFREVTDKLSLIVVWSTVFAGIHLEIIPSGGAVVLCLAGAMIVTLLIFAWCLKRCEHHFRIGETDKLLAYKWEPVRRKILKTCLVTRLLYMKETRGSIRYNLVEEWLEYKVRCEDEAIGRYETGGLLKDKKKAEDEKRLLTDIASAFGIQLNLENANFAPESKRKPPSPLIWG